MKRVVVLLLTVVLASVNLYSQKVITMTKRDGNYTLLCKINGVPSNMAFNPGMEKVVIPVETAKYLYQNGILTTNDFSSADDHLINISKLEIEGLVVNNVSAIISESYSGPPVLGQSAINKLGQYRVDGDKLYLLDFKTDKSYAISYGDKWLDKESLYERIDRKATAYASYLYLKGDQRTDFFDRLNDIIKKLWNGQVRFCKTTYGEMALCGVDNYGFYYNKYGKRLENKNRGEYYDIGQAVVNYILGIADALSKGGSMDINGVIK